MLNTNEVRIETCTKCNYSCVFCPHSTTFSRNKEVMGLIKFKYIVEKIKRELPDITDITISGFGEAFMDDTILEKIRYAKEFGYKIHVLTNGDLLEFSHISEMDKIGVETIRISLHSIDSEDYQKITKANLYRHESVLNKIFYITMTTNIDLILTFDIIDNINDIDIEEIKEMYGQSATIEVWKPHNWVDTFKYRKGPIIKSTCGRPWNSPYQIQVDGTVNMCCFDYNGKLLLGDFLNQTMKEIFESEAYIDLKKHHEHGTLEQTQYICKNCDQRKSQEDAIIFNNKFTSKNRLNRTSTNYAKI